MAERTCITKPEIMCQGTTSFFFFSTINLTLQVQNGGKIEFYSWRDLKQRREELILKDANEAGNAIPIPALWDSAACRNENAVVISFKISAWKYRMQAEANIKVLWLYHSSCVFLVYFDKNSLPPYTKQKYRKACNLCQWLTADGLCNYVCLSPSAPRSARGWI